MSENSDENIYDDEIEQSSGDEREESCDAEAPSEHAPTLPRTPHPSAISPSKNHC